MVTDQATEARASPGGRAGTPRRARDDGPPQAGDAAPHAVSDDDWMRSQRVSVLMATYNRARYIEEALQSLLAQTRPPDEVIVVDDGSTDDTHRRVLGFAPPVRYIGKANGGKSSAINRGLAEATGDWIWCFDDDDAALPRGLEHLLRAAAQARDVDFVYGGQVTGASGADGRIVGGRTVIPPAVPADELFVRGLRNIPFLLPAALVRGDRFRRLRGFDERYARSHDYEFLLRLLVDAKGVRVPQPIFIWRSHDGPRGPEHRRHDAALRERVWMEIGGQLGQDLRRRLPLAAYLPRSGGAAALGMHNLRRALLERMAVMASKGLLREMLTDLHSAASLRAAGEDAALDADEARACWEVANFQFFQMRLLDAPRSLVDRLVTAADTRSGRAILARVARGLLHAARHRDRSAPERRVLVSAAVRLFLACGPVTSAGAYLPARAA